MSPSAPRPRGRQPDPHLADQWQHRLQRYRASGQTVAAFCAAEGVSVASFYAWQRRLRATTPPTPKIATAFVPVHLRRLDLNTTLELLLPDGLVLRLPADVEPLWLRQLLDLPGGATPC
jgi:hypothetical protein